MPDKPENVILTQSQPSASPEATASQPVSGDPEYPKALYSKKQSKPGALVSKLVQSAEEEKAAGDEWVPHAALKLEEAE